MASRESKLEVDVGCARVGRCCGVVLVLQLAVRNLGRLKGVDFLWDAKRNPNLATAASRRSAVSLSSFVELNCVSATANISLRRRRRSCILASFLAA